MTATQHLGFATERSVSVPSIELDQRLPSRATAISPFVDQLMRFIRLFTAKFRASEAEEDIEIAVREALANAVIHGNRENPDKYIDITCRCTTNGDVSITVRDEGEGFDSHAVPDPTDANRQLLNHGRGLRLMRALMDEVSWEQNGTVVQMRKQMRAR